MHDKACTCISNTVSSALFRRAHHGAITNCALRSQKIELRGGKKEGKKRGKAGKGKSRESRARDKLPFPPVM